MGFEGDGLFFSLLSLLGRMGETQKSDRDKSRGERKRGGGLRGTRGRSAWRRDWSTIRDKVKCERAGLGERGWSRFKFKDHVHCN